MMGARGLRRAIEIAIWREIADVQVGRFKVEDSPLRHVLYDLVDEAWRPRPYPRAKGVFRA